MSWRQTTLGEIADIVSGSTPRSGVPHYWDGAVAWATPTDLSRLDGKHLDKTDRMITEAGLNECSARLLPPGSVLFSSRAPIGLVAINTAPMATNQGFKSFVPRPEVNADYLYWWLKANRKQLEDLGNGATFKEVSKAVVSRVKFPLPPLTEQRRIAAILDKADAIRRKREQALILADDFLRSVFLEMFGDPTTNSKGWRVGRIRECLAEVVAGWSAVGEPRPARPDEMGVLKISAVTSGEYLPEENKAVTSKGPQKSIIVPREGDLLFSRANTRELVAATCLVVDAPANVFLPDKLWRLDPDQRVADVTYLKFVLTDPDYRRRLCAQATGTSGSMLNISKAKLLDHEIPIPPLEIQIDFAKLWRVGRKVRASISGQLAEATNLFAALSQRAFAGDL